MVDSFECLKSTIFLYYIIQMGLKKYCIMSATVPEYSHQLLAVANGKHSAGIITYLAAVFCYGLCSYCNLCRQQKNAAIVRRCLTFFDHPR